MKIIILSCYFILAVQTTSAQLANWARTGGGFGNDEIHAISTQPSGTSFVCGNFYSPCAFDTIQFSLPDSANAFVAKINEFGTTLWVKYFPKSSNNYGTVIDVAAAWDGGCFMTGFWTDSLWLDTTLLITNGSDNSFFSKLDENGSILWVTQPSGSWSRSSCVATNNLGEVYFTGNYLDTMSIDTITIINTLIGGVGAFIAKFDSTGQLLWLRNIQGSLQLNDIAIDIQGSVVVTGFISSYSIIIVDTVQLTNNGRDNIIIAKYDSTGQLLWVKQDGGASLASGNGIAICPNNDILISGSYSYSDATFDTITIPYLSGDDNSGFVARYNQDGNIRWVNYQSSDLNVWNYTINTVAGNTIYFGGFYDGSLFFSNGSFMESGPASYLAACDYDGNMIWVKKFAGGNFNFDFSIDSNERIYISGIFLDSIIVTPYHFITQGQTDFFFAQLAASTVGIQQSIVNSELIISPNPSKGNLILKLSDDNFANSVLQIIDGLGALVMQEQINQSQQTRIIEINLDPGLNSGLYTLVWMNKDKLYLKRIVLQR